MSLKHLKKALAVSVVMLAPFLTGKAQAHDWNGIYGGANFGQGWGNGDTEFNPLPSAATFVNLKPQTLSPDPNGAIGGLQLGVNWGGPHWVWGIETDAQTSDVKGQTTETPIIQNNGTPFPGGGLLLASQETQWWGSTRLRLGHSWGSNGLVYLTGGAAYGRVHYIGSTDFRPSGTTVYASNFSKTETGWIAGAGFEWGIGDHMSMRAEYDYYDLGNESRVVNPTPALPPFQVGYSWQTQQQDVRFGINYRFR